MTADAGAVTTRAGTDSPWRAVGLFVLLTTCLSAIFWALINLTATVTAICIFALMWMPGPAAILTCRILGRPLSTLGLGRWNGRFILIAYLIPIAYCLVASVGTVVSASVASRMTDSSGRWPTRWGCPGYRPGR